MKYLKGTLGLFIKSQAGGVSILVIILMATVLLGMTALVIDVGDLYQARRDMVIAADSSALAGAQELIFDPDNVEAVADHYAKNINNADQFELLEVTDYSVKVKVVKEVDHTFGWFMTSNEVEAEAKAITGAIVVGKDLIPVAFKESLYQELSEGEEGEFLGFHDLGPGNWGVLTFNYQGYDQTPFPVAKYIEEGYPDPVTLADPGVYTSPGTASGGVHPAVYNALVNRIGDVVYVPIVNDEMSSQGSEWIEVVGFAAVRITDVYGNAPNVRFSGKFEYTVAPGDIDPTAQSYGLKGVKLVRTDYELAN